MATDPAETTDLAELHPDVVERLDRAYQEWRREVGNVALEPRQSGDGRRLLGPDPALDIHDGDFSFAVEIGPNEAVTDRGQREVIAARAGSWSLAIENGFTVASDCEFTTHLGALTVYGAALTEEDLNHFLSSLRDISLSF